jgi:hypothetical protein
VASQIDQSTDSAVLWSSAAAARPAARARAGREGHARGQGRDPVDLGDGLDEEGVRASGALAVALLGAQGAAQPAQGHRIGATDRRREQRQGHLEVEPSGIQADRERIEQWPDCTLVAHRDLGRGHLDRHPGGAQHAAQGRRACGPTHDHRHLAPRNRALQMRAP